MSKRNTFWVEDTFFFFPTYAFSCCLKEKTSRAMKHSCSTYLVSEMLSVWCGPHALSNRWWVCVTQMGSSVPQPCAPGHTQKTAFPFICGISFLVVARGMIAVWHWVWWALVLCSCYGKRKWWQQHIMSTGSDCGPNHAKCRIKPGLSSVATKMWLLQWSFAIFSVWGVVSWSIWSGCKTFSPCFLLRSDIQST